MAETVRVGRLLRACMDVLRDAAEPLTKHAVHERVGARLTFTPYEQQTVQGDPRWQNFLGWHTGDMATVGWMSKRDGLWEVIDAGIAAAEKYDDDELYAELQRRYAEIREQRLQAVEALTGAERTIAEALSVLDPGSWTAYEDIAALADTDADTVAHFLAGTKSGLTNAYRVLAADGSIPPDGMRHMRFRGRDIAKKLRSEGLEFDGAGRADQNQRIRADDFASRLDELDTGEPTTQRAWLVRGSSVDGRDLVPVWLHKESVSLSAAKLRPVTPPIPYNELKTIVDDDYQHKSYAARETRTTEFDQFCNRMRPGDYVLTTTQGKAYVGHIDGHAQYVISNDGRSNLRRLAHWLNPTAPVPFIKLPNPLPAKLHSQSDVVDLTEDIPAIEQLLAALGTVRATPPVDRRELEFPPINPDLANELLIDHDWLQQQADLLWERKQLIFYGPPGTGKTYLADKLAAHLTEPAAIKLVQFHPSYTYEDFFEGFRPAVAKDGQLAFELRQGPFRQLVEAAAANPADPYILIIDEINRANLAKVFGELYFLLEYRDHPVDLLYSSQTQFTLPPNVFLIGTMNTTDRSVALVDAAMRRRFAFVELHPSIPPTAGLLASWLARQPDVEYNTDAATLLAALNARIEDHDLAIGPSFFMRNGIYRRVDGLAQVWQTSIMPLLAEYYYGNPPEMLDQFRLDRLRKSIATSGEPAP